MNHSALCRHLARSVHAPGGWGAEESGTRSGPGLEATSYCFAGQLGMCLSEIGPHYDSLNERVIQAVKNAAGRAGPAVHLPRR